MLTFQQQFKVQALSLSSPFQSSLSLEVLAVTIKYVKSEE